MKSCLVGAVSACIFFIGLSDQVQGGAYKIIDLHPLLDTDPDYPRLYSSGHGINNSRQVGARFSVDLR